MATTETNPETFTQEDGVVVVPSNSYHHTVTQLSFHSTCTTGTLDVYVKYHPLATEETVFEEDGVTPLTIDIATPRTIQLTGKFISSFTFSPEGIDGEYTPLIASSYTEGE